MTELFLNIVNLSLSASWMILVVLALRLILKNTAKWVRVLLWGIIALRLVFPFSIESALSLLPSAEVIPNKILSEPTFRIQTGLEPIDSPVNHYLGSHYYEGVTVPANTGFNIMTILSIVWVMGLLSLAGYTIVSYLRLHKKVNTAILLQDNIYQSEHLDSPFVLGILKPQIYLPFGMDNQTIDYVIAHEQAHIKRGDHIWKPFGFLLLTIYWFNPLMWLAYLLLCRDIELACDEKVIKELDKEHIADYAQALLVCSVNHKTIAACPIAFGEVGVKERVKAMLHYKKPAFWVIVVSILACVIVAICFLTNPETEENSQGDITESTESIVENTDETVAENVGEGTAESVPETVDEGTAESVPEIVDEGTAPSVPEIVDEGTAPSVPESTEEPSLFPYDFGSADLDRDGQNETFRVSEVAINQVYRLDVLSEDGTVLWSKDAGIPHLHWESIFLCTTNGQDYLLRYSPSIGQGYFHYSYELLWIENDAIITAESDSVELSLNPGEQPDEQKLKEMNAFGERINELLSSSVVLLSTKDFVLIYGGGPTADFLETFSDVYNMASDIG